jgi:hypothetical protein
METTLATSPTLTAEPSAAVLARAQAEGLGALCRTFRPERTKLRTIIAQVVMGLICLPIVVGLYFFYLMSRSPNVNRKQAAKRMHLFDNGLMIEDSTGPVRSYRWETVTVFQEITRRYVNGVYVGTLYMYTLIGPDGVATKLTGFYEKPQEWGPAIQSELTRVQLPAALAALDAGKDGRFGDLVVNREGITSGNKSIRWAEIEDVKISQGIVFLKKSGKWTSWSRTAVKNIPNFFLFLSIADRMLQVTRG